MKCAKCNKENSLIPLINWCNKCEGLATTDCWLEHKRYIRHYCMDCYLKVIGKDEEDGQITSTEETEREA